MAAHMLVVVREDPHAGRPHDVQDRQVGCVVEQGEAALGGRQGARPPPPARTPPARARSRTARRGLGLAHRLPTVADELVDVEHGSILAPRRQRSAAAREKPDGSTPCVSPREAGAAGAGGEHEGARGTGGGRRGQAAQVGDAPAADSTERTAWRSPASSRVARMSASRPGAGSSTSVRSVRRVRSSLRYWTTSAWHRRHRSTWRRSARVSCRRRLRWRRGRRSGPHTAR